jgi:hypothetical protein
VCPKKQCAYKVSENATQRYFPKSLTATHDCKGLFKRRM